MYSFIFIIKNFKFMAKPVLITLAFLIFIASCQNSTSSRGKMLKNDKEKSKAAKQNTNSNTSIIFVDIQPFSDIPNEVVNYEFAELKKVYPNLTLKRPIELPHFAFYRPRNRYKADLLREYLGSNTYLSHVTLGLTSKDISTIKGAIADWGVMGLGACPGNSCIVSTFRLAKEEMLMQLYKVCIHELGHTQGLQHCSVKTCFMRDAEGKNTTNDEIEFCQKCKAYLVARGWQFK